MQVVRGRTLCWSRGLAPGRGGRGRSSPPKWYLGSSASSLSEPARRLSLLCNPPLLPPLLEPSSCCSRLCDRRRVRVTRELYIVGGRSGERNVDDFALERGAGRAGLEPGPRLATELDRCTGAGNT